MRRGIAGIAVAVVLLVAILYEPWTGPRQLRSIVADAGKANRAGPVEEQTEEEVMGSKE